MTKYVRQCIPIDSVEEGMQIINSGCSVEIYINEHKRSGVCIKNEKVHSACYISFFSESPEKILRDHFNLNRNLHILSSVNVDSFVFPKLKTIQTDIIDWDTTVKTIIKTDKNRIKYEYNSDSYKGYFIINTIEEIEYNIDVSDLQHNSNVNQINNCRSHLLRIYNELVIDK
jgi:hypothetical protein